MIQLIKGGRGGGAGGVRRRRRGRDVGEEARNFTRYILVEDERGASISRKMLGGGGGGGEMHQLCNIT